MTYRFSRGSGLIRSDADQKTARTLGRLRVIACLTPAMLLAATAPAFGQASIKGYTETGGNVQTQVPLRGVAGANAGAIAGVERARTPRELTRTPAPNPNPTRVPAASRETGGGEPGVNGLPFTGADLFVIGGVGLLLAGLGVGLRQLTSPRTGV